MPIGNIPIDKGKHWGNSGLFDLIELFTLGIVPRLRNSYGSDPGKL
jgi:hypothetical protein